LRQIRIRSKLKRCTAPNTAYKNCLFRYCQVCIGSPGSIGLSRIVGWVLKRFYWRLIAKLRRIADAFSFVLVMGGLCGFISALIVHNYLSHDFGWHFPYIMPMSLEAVLTAIFAIACVGAMFLGALLALVVEERSPSQAEPQK